MVSASRWIGVVVLAICAGCAVWDPDEPEGAAESEAALMVEPPYEASLTAAPARVELGQRVTVTWHAPAMHSPYDYVGMYRVGAADGQPLTGQYVYAQGQSSGDLYFTIPLTSALDTGPFEFRYFAASFKLATSNAVVGYADYALTDTPATVELGQQVSVTWHAPLAHSPYDYVGLYKVGTPDSPAISGQYVYGQGQTSGTLVFTIPLTTALDPGPYEFRYFVSGIQTATSASILGYADYALTDTPAAVELGQPVSVTWHAPLAHSPYDYVGLYKVGAPDSPAIAGQYVYGQGRVSGTLTFTLPLTTALDPGAYEFRYFYSGVKTATSASFTGYADYAVTAGGPCRAERDLPALWLAPLAHSPYDYIGIYRAGDTTSPSYGGQYVYGSGSRSGTALLRGFDGGALSFELRYYYSGVVTAVSGAFPCTAN
jgi:hypothetical protein